MAHDFEKKPPCDRAPSMRDLEWLRHAIQIADAMTEPDHIERRRAAVRRFKQEMR